MLFLIILFFILMSPFWSYSQDNSDPCNTPPKQDVPPDNADDNFSFYSAMLNSSGTPYYYDLNPFIGILKTGNFEAMGSLLREIGRQSYTVETDFNPQTILKHIDLLIIPSGGLMDLWQSEYFKLLLEEFLERGGKILCFVSQDSSNYQVIPVPMENL